MKIKQIEKTLNQFIVDNATLAYFRGGQKQIATADGPRYVVTDKKS